MKKLSTLAAPNDATVRFLDLATTEVPAFRIYQWDNGVQPASVFEEKQIIATSLRPYGDAGIQIQYIDKKNKPMSRVVPNTFLADVLSPEKYKKLQEKYIEYMMANPYPAFSFSGLIGSDPEVFVEDEKGNIIPAFDFLPSKAAPLKHHYNTCYWDGFQAEFTTQPGGCMDGHTLSIQNGLQGIFKAARKHNPKARLSIKTVFDIPPQMLIEGKQEHIQFGCMPSLNAYGMKGSELPGHEVLFRPAGGHIHLGFYDDQMPGKDTMIKMVKALDAVLAVACVSMFAKFDNPRRRELYGLAGEYRLPKHGLEYRVISNAWLIHPVIANIVFDLARSVAMFGAKDMLHAWDCEEKETIRIVNTCDVKAARKVLKKNSEILRKLISTRYNEEEGKNDRVDYAFNVIMKGVEAYIKTPDDIIENWSLEEKIEKTNDGWTKNANKHPRRLRDVVQLGYLKKKA